MVESKHSAAVPDDDGYANLILALDADMDQDSRSNDAQESAEGVPATDHPLPQDEIPGFEIGGAVDLALNQLKLAVKGHFQLFRTDVLGACQQTVAAMTSQQQITMQEATSKIQQLQELAAKLQLCHDRAENRDQHRISTMLVLAAKWRCVKTTSRSLRVWLQISRKLKRLQSIETSYAVPRRNRFLKRITMRSWRASLQTIQKTKREELFKTQLDLVSRKLVTTYEANLNAMRAELSEAKRQIAMLVQNKEKMEREMKQAFLRSVSALNLEAMSMFNSKIEDRESQALPGETIEPRSEIPQPQPNNKS